MAITNYLLFNLQKHSNHHCEPTKVYQILENPPHYNQLPTGYAGCLILSLIPGLWFSMMDPLLDEAVGRQKKNC